MGAEWLRRVRPRCAPNSAVSSSRVCKDMRRSRKRARLRRGRIGQEMKTQMAFELAQAGSCHAVSEGFGKPARALGRADADFVGHWIPMDNNTSEQRARSGGGAEELLWLGFPMERPAGNGDILDLHIVFVEAQSPEMADIGTSEQCRQPGAKFNQISAWVCLPWNLDAAKRSELGEPSLLERDDTS